MANLDDLKQTPGWQSADAQRRTAMVKLWNANPEKRDAYLGAAQMAGVPPSLATPTPAQPSAQPTPVPVPVAPGRQMAIPKELLPSPTQMGIDAAILATLGLAPEGAVAAKAAQLLGRYGKPALTAARMALPAIGGAIGAKAGGESPTEGAALGAGEAVLGEAGARLLEGPIQRMVDTSRITRAIKTKFPWLKNAVGKFGGVRGLESAFVEGEGEALTAKRLNRVKAFINQTMKNRPVPLSPQMVKVFEETNMPISQISTPTGLVPHATTEEIDKALTLMGDMGWLPNGNIRTGTSAPELRRIYGEAVDNTIEALNGMRKGLGNKYGKARQEYYEVRRLRDLFQPEGGRKVITNRGKIDMQTLQERLLTPDVYKSMQSSPRLREFANSVFRGAKTQAGTDMPFGINVHMFGAGRGVPEGVLRTVPGKKILPRYIGQTVRRPLRAGLVVGVPELLQGAGYVLGDEDVLTPGQPARGGQ